MRHYRSGVQSSRVQGSALPLAIGAASLIEQETLMVFVQHPYGPREFDDVIAKFKMAFETCDIIISDS